MIKKTALSALAALGLLAAPAGVAASATPEAPAPVEASAPPPAPFRGTDARSTRYYVPKGVRQRSRSRLTLATREWFSRLLPNRFLRRSLAKAALAGRGRSEVGAGTHMYVRQIHDLATGKLTGARTTTRRAIESRVREEWFERRRLELRRVAREAERAARPNDTFTLEADEVRS